MKSPILALSLLALSHPTFAAPTIDSQPKAIYGDEGAVVIFSIAATASAGDLSFVWKHNGNPLSNDEFVTGSTFSRLVISPARLGDAGDYTVTVSDNSGSVVSSVAALTLDLLLPVISAEPEDVTQATGSNARFSVAATDVDSYQWYLGENALSDGNHYSGSSTPTLQIGNTTQADNGVYSVRLSNNRGTLNSRPARLTVTNSSNVGDAADTNIVVIKNPDGWSAQTGFSNDGVDSIRSAGINANGSTEMSFGLYGPGELNFQWWASSENPDRFLFHLDNTASMGISGEGLSWAPISAFVPQGNHLARWQYTKDSSVVRGEDAGFVDEFSFMPYGLSSVEDAVDGLPGTISFGGSGVWYGQDHDAHDSTDAARAPAIGNSQSAWFETTVMGPGEVVFWSKTSSENPDRLHFRVDGLSYYSVSGNSDWTEVTKWIPWGEHSLRWSYEKDGSVARLEDTVWVDQISYTPVTGPSLAEAADEGRLQWETSESNPWFGQTRFAEDGIDAVQSGITGDNGESWIKATLNSSQEGSFTFRWKTLSESPDHLRFYVDGSEISSIRGVQDWAQYTIENVGPGPVEFMWKYTKDGSVAQHEDAGWIDQVAFIPVGDAVTLTVAPSAYGSPSPAVGLHTYDWGASVTASVANVITGLTKYECTGWTGTGSVPTTGTTNEVVISSIEADSTISWNWAIKHMLEVSVSGSGTVGPTPGFYPEGSTQNLVASPAAGWLFLGWSGDAMGIAESTSVVMSAPRTITAIFSDDADEDGLTNTEEAALGSNPRLADTDGDGFGDKLEVDNGGSPTVSDAWRVEHIRSNGENFDLYPADSIKDVALGQKLFDIEGDNGFFSVQLMETQDLVDWFPLGEPVQWIVPVDSTKKFLRVTIPQP